VGRGGRWGGRILSQIPLQRESLHKANLRIGASLRQSKEIKRFRECTYRCAHELRSGSQMTNSKCFRAPSFVRPSVHPSQPQCRGEASLDGACAAEQIPKSAGETDAAVRPCVRTSLQRPPPRSVRAPETSAAGWAKSPEPSSLAGGTGEPKTFPHIVCELRHPHTDQLYKVGQLRHRARTHANYTRWPGCGITHAEKRWPGAASARIHTVSPAFHERAFTV